eukprot:Rmarinus@m.15440
MSGIPRSKRITRFDTYAVVIEQYRRTKEEQKRFASRFDNNSLGIFDGKNKFRKQCINLVEHSWFEYVVIFITLLNCVFLAVESSFDENPVWLDVAEWVFISIFTIEMCLKVVAFGFYQTEFAYLRDPWSRLDFAVVVLSYVGLLPGFGNYSVIRTFRLLRSMKTLSSMPGLRVITRALLEAGPVLVDVAIQCAFVFLFFSVLGMQVFSRSLSGKYEYFEHIGWSLLTIFQCLTLESWQTVMVDVMHETSDLAVIFFVCLTTIGSFFVLNFALAAIMEKFREQVDLDKQIRRRDRPNREEESGSPIKERVEKEGWAQWVVDALWRLRDLWDEFGVFCSRSKVGQAYFALQARVHPFATHSYFENFIMLAIVVNTLTLMIEHHGMTDKSEKQLETANTTLTLFFNLELLFKLLGLGPREYLQHRVNQFDAFIVVVSDVELFLLDTQTGVSAFRAFRLFRVLKLARTWESLRRLLSQIYNSLEPVATFMPLWLLFTYIFVILGIQLFKDGLGEGDDRPRMHFDTVYFSFLTVIQIQLGADWYLPMRTAMDNVGMLSNLFFVVVVMVGNLLIANFFLIIVLVNVEMNPFEHSTNIVQKIKNVGKDKSDGKLRNFLDRLRFSDKLRVTPLEGPPGSADGVQDGALRSDGEGTVAAVQATTSVPVGGKGECTPGGSPLVVGSPGAHGTGSSGVESITTPRTPLLPFNTPSPVTVDPDVGSAAVVTPVNGTMSSVDPDDDGLALVTLPSNGCPPQSGLSRDGLQHARSQNSLPALESPSPSPSPPPQPASPSRGVNLNPVQLVSSPPLQATTTSTIAAVDAGGGTPTATPVATLDGHGENTAAARPCACTDAPNVMNGPDVGVGSPTTPSRRSLVRQALSGKGSTDEGVDQDGEALHDVIRDPADLGSVKNAGGGPLVDVPPIPIPRRDPSHHRVQEAVVSLLKGGHSEESSHPFGVNADKGSTQTSPRTANRGRQSLSDGTDDSEARNLTFREAAQQLAAEESARRSLAVIRSEAVSLFVFERDHPVRRLAWNVLAHRYFDWCILGCICVSSILLAFEDSDFDEDSDLATGLWYADVVFTSIFGFELLVKVIALGLVLHEGAYLRDPWNWLDLFVVVTSVLSLSYFSSLKGMRALRAFRALRPIGKMKKFKHMRILVQCIAHAIPACVHIGAVSSLFWIIFGVLGVQMFKGTFYSCNDPSFLEHCASLGIEASSCGRAECEGTFFVTTTFADGLARTYEVERHWRNFPSNFDHVLNAMMSVGEIVSLESFDIMYKSIDVSGEDLHPIRDNHPEYGMYFVIALLIGVFFVLNIFITITVETYEALQMNDKGYADLTKDQREWLETSRRIYAHKFRPFIPVPQNKIRAFCYSLQNHRLFEPCVLVIIMLNMVVMAMYYETQSYALEQVQMWANVIFTALYLIEITIRCLGVGFRRYVESVWNRFDITIVAISSVSIVISFVGATIHVNPNLIRFLRVFRLVRILRLIHRARGLRLFLQTLKRAVHPLFWVTVLLLLFFFVYAVLGLQLFPDSVVYVADPDYIPPDNYADSVIAANDLQYAYFYDKGETFILGPDLNFRTFMKSMLTLFVCLTGENWPQLMRACMRRDDCDDDLYPCGSSISLLYFVSFVFLGRFIVLNLFIGVVIDAFNSCAREEEFLVDYRVISEFEDHWRRFDPKGCNYIDVAADLAPFIEGLKVPLGLDGALRKTLAMQKAEIMAIIKNFNSTSRQKGMVQIREVLWSLAHRAHGYIGLPDELEEELDHQRSQCPELGPRLGANHVSADDLEYHVGATYAACIIQRYLRERRHRAAIGTTLMASRWQMRALKRVGSESEGALSPVLESPPSSGRKTAVQDAEGSPPSSTLTSAGNAASHPTNHDRTASPSHRPAPLAHGSALPPAHPDKSRSHIAPEGGPPRPRVCVNKGETTGTKIRLPGDLEVESMSSDAEDLV